MKRDRDLFDTLYDRAVRADLQRAILEGNGVVVENHDYVEDEVLDDDDLDAVESLLANVLCTVGDAYNETFEEYFGSYRLSHTIAALHGGVEPPWLKDLHRVYEKCKEEGRL